MKKWVWQDNNWPKFTYAAAEIAQFEKDFLKNSGYLLGAYQHVSTSDQEQIKIDLVCEEAIESSAIEGKFLDRSSVQASLRRNFGLESQSKPINPSEEGAAYLMTDLYKNYSAPLSANLLYDWHLNLMNAEYALTYIGRYRQHDEAMQIISGAGNNINVHYEAPPSNKIADEMTRYIAWFNDSHNLPPIIRAGIAHLYFEIIHPFEDGNGRMGRAIAEKSLSQSLNAPILSGLSRTIKQNKKQYYAALANCNSKLEITEWLIYFANLVLSGQNHVRKYIEFLIAKTKLYDRVGNQLNERQLKVIARIFKESLDGFKGGLSAENYLAITQTSRATATRDLQDLVSKKIFFSTGELKSTRYFLKL
jgi:Fic family protein